MGLISFNCSIKAVTFQQVCSLTAAVSQFSSFSAVRIVWWLQFLKLCGYAAVQHNFNRGWVTYCLIFLVRTLTLYRVAQKTNTLFVRLIVICLTFIKNWQIFKLISLSKSEKQPSTPQMCRYTTFWNVSVLKATIEKRRPL